MGNLGADPDTKFLPSGDACTNLSIATTEKWKDKEGQQQESTEWHKVVFFGRRAEVIAEYFRKGDQIYVEGKLQTRKWQDKDGNDRWTTEINGRDFQFCGQASGSGNSGGRTEEAPAPAAAPAPTQDKFDDDIPF